MKREPSGTYETDTTSGEPVRAFVPAPLPPDPLPILDGQRGRLHDEAMLACGRLDAVSALLPDPDLFLYAYVRREALLSSQIEGTQSSLSDLLLFEINEAPGVPLDDVVEVSNYIDALDHGLARLGNGFPLSNRLLREMHARLLARGRGADKQPGAFRTTQNWLGGTRREMRHSCRHHRIDSRTAWRIWSASFMHRRRHARRWSRPHLPTSSSKRFTRSWTATAVLDGFSLR